MTDVKSKNLYELLGNTSDQDSDREPEPPTKTVDKPAARHGKREAPKAAPAAPTEVVGGQARGGNRRQGGFSGSEAAFRDRATGRNYNRDQPTGEGEPTTRPGRDSGPGVRRAGRGPRGPRRGGDRHSRTGISEHPKQEGQGWGQATGEGEWADEKAGEAIATAEVKEGGYDANPEAPVDGEGNTLKEEPEEPEDTHKSYADYLAEKAAKKLEGLGLKEARQANEGTKENKKWSGAKELSKDAENEDYFVGQERARRERERASKKEYLDIDYSFKEPARDTRGGRGGRGGPGRGRGGRGGERGGDFAGRGRGRGRGRGGADGAPANNTGAGSVAVNDESAFPSLGGK